MIDSIYNKEITCPVCGQKFNVTKVKLKTCKVESRDTDFCVNYKDINPMFYDAWVCDYCGYAAQADKFEEIGYKEADIVLKEIKPKWNKRVFSGERTVDTALEAFKLVLLNHKVRGAKASEMAKVCMRIAWLYRIKQDSRELDFLKFALNYYTETYKNEHFPADKLDENTCMYMIGELSCRTGDYENAVKWLSKLISSPEARKNTQLIEAARDQYQLVKEKMGN